jgi:hypothetical protein
MNPRLAALLTRAHAPAFRRRYGAEFCALLEELPATPAIVTSAATSALSSQAPVLATIGAFALAAAILALGPSASNHHGISAQTPAPRAVKVGTHLDASVSCDSKVAYVAPDGSVRC